ncbi:MAG: phytanoyl-CoA dioxygenase family protein, partial [Flavobacteriaceae bacterium]|nr:phytanoyl-CoA dioxygenase family protein [Flavobacteriaceae bacterium]
MKEAFYGNFTQTLIDSDLDMHLERIRVQGFTVIENVLSEEMLEKYRYIIDAVYQIQLKEYGAESLDAIKEKDLCRFCLKYDPEFLNIATNKIVIKLVEAILGSYYILNLQNAIINRPNIPHHQQSWHRDLAYLNGITSEPLAINALFAIDDFSQQTGGTVVLPYSHKQGALPSDAFIESSKITAEIKAGGVVVFDSMLFHRAGNNTSDCVRRAVNHVYTKPLLKQQYDIAGVVGARYLGDPYLRMFLGVDSAVPQHD